MNIVLLSGGSGKRLWPLSNDALSKQFLKLLKDEKGNYESMVQRVVRQLKQANPDAGLTVSCNESQVGALQKQLGLVDTIPEPARRNTFPAVVMAAAHLHYNKGLNENEVFVFLPIDVFAEDAYFQLLPSVEKLANKYSIGLMGAIPTYPSEKYGYISHESGRVTSFVEKPDLAAAQELIAGNALWNCGAASLKVGYVLERARKYLKFFDFSSLYTGYNNLPATSFDYEVIEKEASAGVVVYAGNWKDIGTWNTFAEEMSTSTMGNVLVSENSLNTNVLNMLNIPIIVQDISDAVVIAAHDGVLVTSKPGSSFLKPLTEQISLRPMYEQQDWGDYRILDYKLADAGSSLVKRVRVEPGKSINHHCNMKYCEAWIVVRGKGILTVGGKDSVVSSGSVVEIPSGVKHSLLAATEVELVEVRFGSGELEEEGV